MITAHTAQTHGAAAELARALGGRRNRRGWMARCPAHDDRDPSLSIADGVDGRIEEKVAAALQEMDLPMPEELCTVVQAALMDQPAASWRTAIERVADQLLASQDHADTPPESEP